MCKCSILTVIIFKHGFNLLVISCINQNGLKENSKNLNFTIFLLKRNEVFLLLLANNVVNSSHDQGESCLSAVFFDLLTCCHVQFLKIFHLPSFFSP